MTPTKPKGSNNYAALDIYQAKKKHNNAETGIRLKQKIKSRKND